MTSNLMIISININFKITYIYHTKWYIYIPKNYIQIIMQLKLIWGKHVLNSLDQNKCYSYIFHKKKKKLGFHILS